MTKLRGVVKKWLYEHGFGFIETKGSRKDVFCHSRDIRNCYDLDRGDLVEFEIEKNEKGPRAVNVKIVYD